MSVTVIAGDQKNVYLTLDNFKITPEGHLQVLSGSTVLGVYNTGAWQSVIADESKAEAQDLASE